MLPALLTDPRMRKRLSRIQELKALPNNMRRSGDVFWRETSSDRQFARCRRLGLLNNRVHDRGTVHGIQFRRNVHILSKAGFRCQNERAAVQLGCRSSVPTGSKSLVGDIIRLASRCSRQTMTSPLAMMTGAPSQVESVGTWPNMLMPVRRQII